MPYKTNDELPENVKGVLPEHAQEIYRKAYSNALEQYKDPKDRRGNINLEEVAMKVAWSAVKQTYEKGKDGKWHKSS